MVCGDERLAVKCSQVSHELNFKTDMLKAARTPNSISLDASEKERLLDASEKERLLELRYTLILLSPHTKIERAC